MSFNNILTVEAVQRAVEECEAPDSFCPKKFFKTCGLSSKTEQDINQVFQILDKDGSGHIEESELKFFLQQFVSEARILSETETKRFVSSADDNNDGKIGEDEFRKIVRP